MIAGNKIFAHLGNGQKPVTADIFLTDYCNNACPYCNYVRYKERDGKYMPFSQFVVYVKRLQELGIQGIILTGGGEPTIHPDFDKITELLSEKRVPYGINTNFNQYVDCNPTFLKVSLDGYNPETYKERRGVDAYAQTIANIERFAENHPYVNLGIQQLATNADEIMPFYEAHKSLPVSYIVYRPVESYKGIYYWNQQRLTSAAKIADLVRKMHEDDSRVILNYKFKHIQEVPTDCPAHWSQLAINHLGQVMYCCHKPNEIVGHIMDSDILQKHKSHPFSNSDCDTPCRLTGPNAALRELESIEERMFI